jgi:type II secretion system protein H
VSEKGFTLIEILIVLLIVGLLAVSVVLRGGSHHESVKMVTERLRSIFIYAQQQAILQPATIGFDFDPKKGYQFLIYRMDADSKRGRWETLTSDSILRLYTLPAKITLGIIPENTHPAIIFFPNGETSAFKMNILEDKKPVYQLTGTANGSIQSTPAPR